MATQIVQTTNPESVDHLSLLRAAYFLDTTPPKLVAVGAGLFDSVARCAMQGCESKALSRFFVAALGYPLSAAALLVPFSNSLSANAATAITVPFLNISGTAFIIFVVWFASGLVTVQQRHENAFQCAIYSLGIPGIFLAFMAFVK